MEMSVLERQRVTLRRLNSRKDHNRFNPHSVVGHQEMLPNSDWKPVDSDNHQSLNAVTDHVASPCLEPGNPRSCSAVSRAKVPKLAGRCNSNLMNSGSVIKKRKAELDVEEKDWENGFEAEETGDVKSEITVKTEREFSTSARSKDSSKASEIQKTDYIHVRARRGQATDSHSLAERARREKISKKMKCLQDLVPSCSKVTGKAGILDEIINYVQSLQKQVEFLSMKIAVSNPKLDSGASDLFTHEALAYMNSLPEPSAIQYSLPEAGAAQFEGANSTCSQYDTIHQGGSSSGIDISLAQSEMIPKKPETYSMPIPEMFLDSSDWPFLFNAGFHY